LGRTVNLVEIRGGEDGHAYWSTGGEWRVVNGGKTREKGGRRWNGERDEKGGDRGWVT